MISSNNSKGKLMTLYRVVDNEITFHVDTTTNSKGLIPALNHKTSSLSRARTRAISTLKASSKMLTARLASLVVTDLPIPAHKLRATEA